MAARVVLVLLPVLVGCTLLFITVYLVMVPTAPQTLISPQTYTGTSLALMLMAMNYCEIGSVRGFRGWEQEVVTVVNHVVQRKL